MKKTLKNYEIETIITTLNDKNSFKNNITLKLPQDVRQAIRVNMKTLSDRLSIYEEGRRDIITEFVNDGHATIKENGSVDVEKDFVPQFVQQINELAMVENELELESISDESANKIMSGDISMAEEDVLIMFKE